VRGSDHQPDPALFPADDGTPSPPADNQHSRQWRAQNGRGQGTGDRDWGSTTAIGPRTTDWGVTASLRRTPLDNRSTSRAGWGRETASSGRVSGAVAHLSKLRRAARRRDAIADRMPRMGDHKPAVGRSRMIGRHHGWSAHLMSALTWL